MQVYHEITPLLEHDVFVVLDSYNNGFDYPIHNHPEFELNLVLGSSGERIVGNSTDSYTDHDLVLLGPYLFHKWDGEASQPNGQQVSRVITIQFRMESFNSMFFQKSKFIKIRGLLNDVSRGVAFYGDTFEQAQEMVKGLTVNKGFGSVVDFLNLLHFLSCSNEMKFLASEGFSRQSNPSKGKRIQIANRYILKNFKNPQIRIGHVAELVNMSVSNFSHFFKKYTNKSFQQFIIDVRLGHACKLLLDTDKNIKQISYQSGFNNIANFNRLFLKYRGCTPFEFRQSLNSGSFDWKQQITPGQFVPSRAMAAAGSKPATYSSAKVLHV
jgi:AraC-like DNA-binding protein